MQLLSTLSRELQGANAPRLEAWYRVKLPVSDVTPGAASNEANTPSITACHRHRCNAHDSSRLQRKRTSTRQSRDSTLFERPPDWSANNGVDDDRNP